MLSGKKNSNGCWRACSKTFQRHILSSTSDKKITKTIILFCINGDKVALTDFIDNIIHTVCGLYLFPANYCVLISSLSVYLKRWYDSSESHWNFIWVSIREHIMHHGSTVILWRPVCTAFCCLCYSLMQATLRLKRTWGYLVYYLRKLPLALQLTTERCFTNWDTDWSAKTGWRCLKNVQFERPDKNHFSSVAKMHCWRAWDYALNLSFLNI